MSLLTRMVGASNKAVIATSLFEAALAISRKKLISPLHAEKEIHQFFTDTGTEIVSVDSDYVSKSLEAYFHFGKGSGHPARLNMGDCFSYAFAKMRGLPLLFNGNDFNKTDVSVA
jgi:ribonuclease VapC